MTKSYIYIILKEMTLMWYFLIIFFFFLLFQLNFCTVIDLKEYATTLGFKNLSKYKKNELITLIKEYFM